MIRFLILIPLLFVWQRPVSADPAVGSSSESEADPLLTVIDDRAETGWEAAQKIWAWAEPGYQEVKSAKLLSESLEQAGFEVKRGVADIPTAFIASYGSGHPIIGILGEYDALPGLSQTGSPFPEVREGATYGHGCGHHLFGVASMMACVAIKSEIEAGRLSGTIRYYGCPAEEGGSAKAFLVRAGLFDDCDTVLHWHPSSRNAAGAGTNLARMAVKFRFRGKAAHAAGSPHMGRSALDAVELTNHAAQLLREHTPEGTRIHHVITSGGEAPNVVPAFAEVYYYIRHPDPDVLRELYPRLVACARAGAIGTGTELEIAFEGGILSLLPNDALGNRLLKNLRELNTLSHERLDQEFALKLVDQLPQPRPLNSVAEVTDSRGQISKGSTDVGDVSWVVPTAGFKTACWIPGTPGHSWQAVACGTSDLARDGMILAARVLAVTARDLMTDPELIEAAKQEHRRRRQDRKYRPLIEADQKPPLDYRKPTRAGGR